MVSIMKDKLQQLRTEYQIGTRVRLVKMDDKQAPPIGTEGTVCGVDDTGSVMVHWDNGSSLNVLLDIDLCEVVEKS